MKAAEGAVALTLIDLWRKSKGETLVIFQSEGYAEIVADIVHSFCPECPVMVLPRWDVGPLDPIPPSARVMGRRMAVLHRVATGEAHPLVLCAPEALMQKVPSQVVLASAIHMKVGGQIDPSSLRDDLEGRGYIPSDQVDDPGEYALHGHALDIFPGGALQPLRIDFDYGKITGVHTFDPRGQRNLQDLEGTWIEAASELAGEASSGSSQTNEALPRASVFDYLKKPRIYVENGAETRVAAFEKRVHEAIAYRVALGETPLTTGAFLSHDEWRGILSKLNAKALDHEEIDSRPIPSFIQERNPKMAVRAFVAEKRAAGRRIVFAGAQLREARSLARAAGEKEARPADSWDAIAKLGAPALMTANLKSGFETSQGAVVIAAADLFGSRAARRTPMALDRGDDASEDIFRTNDYVVHQDHGRAIFRGLAPAPEGTGAGELLILEFAGGVRRLAPIGELGRIWKYSGPDSDATLDKLGGDWGEQRSRIESELREVATALLERASARDQEGAARLVPPSDVYEDFVARFPFDLTGDQAAAVETCLGDLASGRRMDRLLVGDVGFGKTEVALRAVAAAALSGSQACIIAPTTVLARQHEEMARRRFTGLGVNVGSLSRLTKPAQARTAKQELASGDTQVAVGTHALLSKSVRFRDLGLVVVDEEHRFGAIQKQKIRALGSNVHILSMSATPIPRSLATAMAGLQDVSILHTPPARRLPVRTIVADFDADLARRALESEHRRRGQSFVVAPRIEDLPGLQQIVAQLAPKLRTGVVHGRLPADELDEVMMNFAAGNIDVLLATNVIESGLDLPRANTIIVTRPDRFGLAQLHQLRGRVGRGVPRGFALLLSAPGQKLTTAARKRLDALARNQHLGAGAAISDLDLDIRGFGDLLGDKQSGRVKLVGPSLYRRMLEDALESARTGRPPRSSAKIETHVDAYIPAEYIPHPDARVRVYVRIDRARSQPELDEIEEELAERFGDPPEPVKALLGLAAVAQACAREGVMRLVWGPKGVSLEFEDGADVGAKPHRVVLDSTSISQPEQLIDAVDAAMGDRR